VDESPGLPQILRAIEPVESLDAVQRGWLDEVLSQHPEIRSADLVVYRLTDGEALVAPRSDELTPGSKVIAQPEWMQSFGRLQGIRPGAPTPPPQPGLTVASRLVLDTEDYGDVPA
jgi:hypothetical protein